MKKYVCLVLVMLPLLANASNVLKDTIKAKRKIEHSKNTLNNTKRNINEINSGTYVENQAKREVNKATSKYTDKVDDVKHIAEPEHIKRKANNEINRQVDEWLYED